MSIYVRCNGRGAVICVQKKDHPEYISEMIAVIVNVSRRIIDT